MNLVREISSLGRNARSAAALKVRQPLAKVEVVLSDTAHQAWLEDHVALIAEELNVKAVEFTTEAQEYISYSVVPNFKALGPRLGKSMPLVKKLLSEADGGALLNELRSTGRVELSLPDSSVISLSTDDVEIRLQPREGWTAAQGAGAVVVLATELTPELIAEGTARDLVRGIQDARKDLGCQFTDRIELGVATASDEVRAAIERHADYIQSETLAVSLSPAALEGIEPYSVKLAGTEVRVYLRVVP
jgi:isoleucyl-tRNA synthetase